MSVTPVVNHIRAPLGTGIIAELLRVSASTVYRARVPAPLQGSAPGRPRTPACDRYGADEPFVRHGAPGAFEGVLSAETAARDTRRRIPKPGPQTRTKLFLLVLAP